MSVKNSQDATASQFPFFRRPGGCFSLMQSDNPREIKTNITPNYKKNQVECYPTQSTNRGTALVINNIQFHNPRYFRSGAKKDEDDLNRVLTKIGFKVKIYRDQKSNDLIKTLKKYSKAILGDICMVIVMSHGTNDGLPGGYTEVLCSDGKKISTDTVVDHFDESRNECLKGKPKIFIFQCCRSNTQVDAALIKGNPTSKSNTLIAYSTIPGFSSHRDPKNGSRYIQTLCEVLDKYAHAYHMEDLLKIVGSELIEMNDDSHKQVSCYENRGFCKKCYLNPMKN
ncbi:hypothetical protein WA026_017199 [Henosepilachna vigintioctopunctata]|uniref:Uncharacterized protein n=1 Tax=Henosepilachna vigintioctopunctata TaxID=420089 RepID=A0AAW1UKC0_9CUCU